MMDDKTRIAFIERIQTYLDSEASDELKHQIKEYLDLYPDAKELLMEEIEVRRSIREAGEIKLKESLVEEYQTIVSRPQKTLKINRRPWLRVAAIGLLLGAAFFLFQEERSEILNPVSDPTFTTVRDDIGPKPNTAWNRAVKSFKLGDYANALKYIENQEAVPSFEHRDAGKFLLLKGVCLWRLDRYEEAEGSLSKIPQHNPYYDQALWYRYNNAKSTDNKDILEKIQTIVRSMENHYKRDSILE